MLGANVQVVSESGIDEYTNAFLEEILGITEERNRERYSWKRSEDSSGYQRKRRRRGYLGGF